MIKLKKHLFLIGIVIIAIGFVYDLVFAGIPYQDPSPQLLEKYNQNAFVSDLIIKFGLFITLIGIVFKIIPSKENK
ncbi:hypothetical protein [Flavobacterium terrisoli]|uniref:hypothetical protein n=1 Tax=Flavobacterium terrisoli TaxID=3242195 RepID=UPI0025436EDC|nr:hypothetical protein [Flavobacterium buctense]